MRIKHLNSDDCQRRYTVTKQRVEEFQFRGQSSWFFQANALVHLAKAAYALGHPLSDCQSWLRQATGAYRELFALRGTSFSKRTKYEDGKPLPEETIADDGYTSVDSFNAALSALTIQEFGLARELVKLAGHSPNANLVSPRSEVCTTNQQTMSHALNALLESDMELAHREASKLAARRATKIEHQIEHQIGLTISAIATEADVLAERDTLLAYHDKLASRRDNHHDSSFWLCLPGLGLSFLSIHFRQYEPTDLQTESVYCPIALLTESDTTAG